MRHKLPSFARLGGWDTRPYVGSGGAANVVARANVVRVNVVGADVVGANLMGANLARNFKQMRYFSTTEGSWGRAAFRGWS